MRPDRPTNFLPPGPTAFVPSEYARANLTLFRETHAYRAVGGDFPGVAGVTYDGTHHLMPLFDLAEIPESQLAAALAGQECFYPVAQPLLNRLDARLFEIARNPDDSDYVYRASDLCSYEQPALRYKARLRADFVAAATPVSTDAAGEEAAMRAVLHGWLRDVGKPASDTDFSQAMEAIGQRAALGLSGRVVFTAAGEAAGFVLAGPLAQDCRVVHFAKGRRAFRGIYPYLFSELARHDAGTVWFNFEQDLGNARFRQNKRSFAPAHMVEKFRIRPMETGVYGNDSEVALPRNREAEE